MEISNQSLEKLEKINNEIKELYTEYMILLEKYQENMATLKDLEPKVGQKRKRWQIN